MSKGAVEKFLFRFDKDAGRAEAWKTRSRDLFEGYDLSEGEKNILLTGDLATLYEQGIHPLLIRNFGATIGVRYVDAYAERGLK